jgi:hypothetical protein
MQGDNNLSKGREKARSELRAKKAAASRRTPHSQCRAVRSSSRYLSGDSAHAAEMTPQPLL